MIISGALQLRGPTRLFVRRETSGEHIFCCDLDVFAPIRGDARAVVAVPVPLLPGSHVSLLDLAATPLLFDELEEHFELPRRRHDDFSDDDDDSLPRERGGPCHVSLAVGRSDLPPALQDCVDVSDDRAFVVVSFAGSPPPFGFRFLPKDDALFFPTQQWTNGKRDAAAVFDHVFYVQGLPLQTGWHKSRKKTQARTAPALAEFVDDNQWIRRRRIHGPHENVDVWVALAQPTLEPRPVPALSFVEQMGLDVLSVSDNDLWGLDDEDDSPDALFLALERRLVDPRSRLRAAEELLAPDFTEIGTSGTRYDRAATLSAMEALPPTTTTISELVTSPLSDELTLVTFRTADSRRSSVWQRMPNGFRLRFHQGTRL